MGKLQQINLNSIISRNQDIIHNDIDDEVVMMSIEKNKYYGIDKIGSHIWAIIEKPRKVEEIIQIMMEHYEVDRDTCENDVIDFFVKASENQLIIIEKKSH